MTTLGPGDKLERLPRDELEELQARALTGFLAGLPSRSPFYHRLLSGTDTTINDARAVLGAAPFTSRKDLQSAQTAEPPWGGLLALQLAVTAEDMRTRVEVAARGFLSGGSGPDDRTVIVGEVARSILHHILLGALARTGSTPFQTGRGLSLRHVRHTLPSLSPTQLVTHPTYALYLARVFKEEGSTLPVERLFLWGEMGPSVPTVRATLEEAWECDAGNGLHGFEDRFVYEVVDPETGELLGPGKSGELVVSTLHAEAMPLLRYRTGDLVMTDDGPCTCGRTHVRLHVMGRVLRRPDGNVQQIDLAKVERLLGRFKALWCLYRVVLEDDRAMREVPMATLDEDQQAVAINTVLLAARSTGIEMRPVKALPMFHHRAVRVVLEKDIDWWETMAEEQRRLEE